MKNAIIDIETLGIGANPYVLTLAATTLEDDQKAIHLRLDLEQQNDGTLTEGTLAWWMSERHSAQFAANINMTPVVGVKTALMALNDFLIGGMRREEGMKNLRVWTWGIAFDIPNLESLYRRFGVDIPWHYQNVCDLRTLALTNKDIKAEVDAMGFKGRPHSALRDAITERKWLELWNERNEKCL
jgi:hypothetical protein